jgi:hypothetical protein
MIIKTKVTTEQQIEVTLPYYAKDNICHWYKVIAEDKMIKLFSGHNDKFCCVDFNEYNVDSAFSDKNVKITEQEFNDKFYAVVTNITNYI